GPGLLPGHQPLPALDRRRPPHGGCEPRRRPQPLAGLRSDARVVGARDAGRCRAPAPEGRLSTSREPASVGIVPPAPAVGVPEMKTEPITELQMRRLGPIRRWFVQHPRGTDIVVVLWFLLPSLISALFPMPLPGLHLALVAATSAALWFRRRYPLHVLAW